MFAAYTQYVPNTVGQKPQNLPPPKYAVGGLLYEQQSYLAYSSNSSSIVFSTIV